MPAHEFEPSPLTQKEKPSASFHCLVARAGAIIKPPRAFSTKENLTALPNFPSTDSMVPAGSFLFLSAAVGAAKSPGLWRGVSMSKMTAPSSARAGSDMSNRQQARIVAQLIEG